jgi:hypothetical protein
MDPIGPDNSYLTYETEDESPEELPAHQQQQLIDLYSQGHRDPHQLGQLINADPQAVQRFLSTQDPSSEPVEAEQPIAGPSNQPEVSRSPISTLNLANNAVLRRGISVEEVADEYGISHPRDILHLQRSVRVLSRGRAGQGSSRMGGSSSQGANQQTGAASSSATGQRDGTPGQPSNRREALSYLDRFSHPTTIEEADALLARFKEEHDQGSLNSQAYYLLSNTLGETARNLPSAPVQSTVPEAAAQDPGPRADPATLSTATQAVARGMSLQDAYMQYGITHSQDKTHLERIARLRDQQQ